MPERHEEAPLLFDLLLADREWSSAADGDPLRATVRSGPGTFYEIATMVEVPRRVIEGTGAIRTDESGVAWRELKLGYERTAGWKRTVWKSTSRRRRPTSTTPARPRVRRGSGTGQRDDQRERYRGAGIPCGADVAPFGPGCDRLHIALGDDWAYSGGALATAVPDGVTVEAFGTWARITIPGLNSARFDADAEQGWDLTSIVARAADGRVVIDVYAPQPSLFAAHVLSQPARVLVDAIPAESDGGGSLSPAGQQLYDNLSDLVAVAWPGALNAENPFAVALPLTVRGYSRWFESVGNIELQHADGTPATATVSGPQVFRPGRSSNWAVTANDYSVIWGTFEFVLDDIEPGEYRLKVGEYDMSEETASGEMEFLGVTIPFVVLEP